MTARELMQSIQSNEGGPVVVDVRTAEEFSGGHIPTAVNIPHTEIAVEHPTRDKRSTIVLYCESGGRSGFAKQMLEMQGFRNVVNFGSVHDWPGELEYGIH